MALLTQPVTGHAPDSLLFSDPAPLIVVAHPDDEIIGAGAQLAHWPGARFVHVTDGAPRDLRDVVAAGFGQRTEYALARRKELTAALAQAGLRSPSLHELGVVDQEAAFNLLEMVRRLVPILRESRPRLVLTHPYEGGHPDHDATAFALGAACDQVCRQEGWRPAVIEMTFYHRREGEMVTGAFLPNAARPVTTIHLTESQRELKRRLFECFATQRQVLASFQVASERFRFAPDYDFRHPPHAGALLYEQFPWGMTRRDWCRLARAALAQLEDVSWH